MKEHFGQFAKSLKNIISIPTGWAKSACPVLVLLCRGFTELRNSHQGENLQPNIVLHQGAVSGSFFTITYKRMSSEIISKLKGIIKNNGQYKRNRKYRNKNMQEMRSDSVGRQIKNYKRAVRALHYIHLS